MECLEEIIGLSETECACFDTDKPTNYNVSRSGLFLDQLEGFSLPFASAADDCARGGIWVRAERALRNAKVDYRNNILGCIGQNYKPKISPLNVQLGESTFQGSLLLSEAFAGLKIMPMQIKGGAMILKRIGIIVNNAVTVTVRVYSNMPSNGTNSTLLYEGDIAANANQITWASLTTPLELPMWSYRGVIRYWVVMLLDGTFQPKDTKKDCGCNGVSKPYLSYLDYTGVKGNDMDSPESLSTTSGANGIALDMMIKCRTADIICSSENPMDYTDDGYALNTAYAIRFRTGARLYDELLTTGEINRYSMLDKAKTQEYRDYWNQQYMEWVNFNCANTSNIDNNSCLQCRDTPTSLIKTTINLTGDNFDWLKPEFHNGHY